MKKIAIIKFSIDYPIVFKCSKMSVQNTAARTESLFGQLPPSVFDKIKSANIIDVNVLSALPTIKSESFFLVPNKLQNGCNKVSMTEISFDDVEINYTTFRRNFVKTSKKGSNFAWYIYIAGVWAELVRPPRYVKEYFHILEKPIEEGIIRMQTQLSSNNYLPLGVLNKGISDDIFASYDKIIRGNGTRKNNIANDVFTVGDDGFLISGNSGEYIQICPSLEVLGKDLSNYQLETKNHDPDTKYVIYLRFVLSSESKLDKNSLAELALLLNCPQLFCYKINNKGKLEFNKNMDWGINSNHIVRFGNVLSGLNSVIHHLKDYCDLFNNPKLVKRFADLGEQAIFDFDHPILAKDHKNWLEATKLYALPDPSQEEKVALENLYKSLNCITVDQYYLALRIRKIILDFHPEFKSIPKDRANVIPSGYKFISILQDIYLDIAESDTKKFLKFVLDYCNLEVVSTNIPENKITETIKEEKVTTKKLDYQVINKENVLPFDIEAWINIASYYDFDIQNCQYDEDFITASNILKSVYSNGTMYYDLPVIIPEYNHPDLAGVNAYDPISKSCYRKKDNLLLNLTSYDGSPIYRFSPEYVEMFRPQIEHWFACYDANIPPLPFPPLPLEQIHYAPY